jgi:hypothetical protein
MQSTCNQHAINMQSSSRSARSTTLRGSDTYPLRLMREAISMQSLYIPTRVRCGALGFGRARHVRIKEQGRGGVLSDLAAQKDGSAPQQACLAEALVRVVRPEDEKQAYRRPDQTVRTRRCARKPARRQ